MNFRALIVCVCASVVVFAQDIPTGFVFKQESAHFKVFSKQEDSSIFDIAKRAETVYVQVTKDLNYTPSDKINIFVFTSVDAHHKYLWSEPKPNFIIGSAAKGNICIVSPTNSGPVHNYQSSILFLGVTVASAIISEMSHKLNRPKWFDLGFGLYEAFDGKIISSYEGNLKSAVLTGQVPVFNELNSANQFFYSCAYSLVEFLIQRHGISAIQALARDFSAFEQVIGMSQEAFYAQWLEHAKKQFLQKN